MDSEILSCTDIKVRFNFFFFYENITKTSKKLLKKLLKKV